MSESAAAVPVEATATPVEAVETTETPAQVQANKKKFMLKVDGQDFEDEVDLNDEKELTKRFQLGKAAEKRMNEAKEAKSKAFEIIKAFEQDPETMLKRLGPKGREIAEKYLLAQIQDEMLSPQEKEMRQLRKDNETYKEKETRETKEREDAAAQKKEYEYAQSFQKTIIEALEKSGMPKTPINVKRMAALMSKNLEYGLELTSDDLAAEVRKESSGDLLSIIKDMTGEQLIEMFGKEMANKIRKADLKALQEKQGQVFNSSKKQSSGSKLAPTQKGYETMEEWKERIAKNIQE